MEKASLKARSENKAVIWDMDGVIADSAPYHFKAWHEVLKKKGVNYTEEQFRQSFGQRNDNIIKKTLGENNAQEEIDAIAGAKEETFRRIARGNLKSLPGVIALLASLEEHGFKMALASSGPRENIQLIIQTLGISNYFQHIIAGRDVTESKPSPQIFLLAAKKLGINPENCVVIEDAIAGVTAAKRAGMYCLAVANTHPRSSLTEADLVVDTLEGVTMQDLLELLGP